MLTLFNSDFIFYCGSIFYFDFDFVDDLIVLTLATFTLTADSVLPIKDASKGFFLASASFCAEVSALPSCFALVAFFIWWATASP